ncbi:MAG: ABC transporter ATP-binding protein [Magnetovibrionaceae bacterium]
MAEAMPRTAETPALEATDLNKAFGALTATDHLSISLAPGLCHGLIGPNGAGKTTAINLLSGSLSADSGTIRLFGEDVTALSQVKRARKGLQRSHQITSLFADFTTLENVALAVQAGEKHAFRFWQPAMKDPSLTEPAEAALVQVGLKDRLHLRAGDLAHGEQRQLELAMVLATKPRVILLDEPMAGMGVAESRRMIEVLEPLKGDLTLLLVEHDMDVVFQLADVITVLVKGHAIASAPPAEIRADEAVRRAYLGDY